MGIPRKKRKFWEFGPEPREKTGAVSRQADASKSYHVMFGKGKVQGSQRTIDHINTTLLAHYIHIQTSLYLWKILKNEEF